MRGGFNPQPFTATSCYYCSLIDINARRKRMPTVSSQYLVRSFTVGAYNIGAQTHLQHFLTSWQYSYTTLVKPTLRPHCLPVLIAHDRPRVFVMPTKSHIHLLPPWHSFFLNIVVGHLLGRDYLNVIKILVSHYQQ